MVFAFSVLCFAARLVQWSETLSFLVRACATLPCPSKHLPIRLACPSLPSRAPLMVAPMRAPPPAHRWKRRPNACTTTLTVWLPAGEQELPELERLISARLVDGVMVARPSTLHGCVTLKKKRGMPFVTYGRSLENAPHARVGSDNAGAARRGHSPFDCIGSPPYCHAGGLTRLTFSVQRP